MTVEDVKKEMEALKRKMKKEYETVGNTQKHQEMFKRYEELEEMLKNMKSK